jgi:hypothetical protein
VWQGVNTCRRGRLRSQEMTPALPGENVSVSGGYYMQARTPAVPGRSVRARVQCCEPLWEFLLYRNAYSCVGAAPRHNGDSPRISQRHHVCKGACLIRVYLCPSVMSALLRASAVWDWGDSVRQAPPSALPSAQAVFFLGPQASSPAPTPCPT